MHIFVLYYPFGNHRWCRMQQTNRCPVGATLEMIGGKYKALILWHLSEETLRFSELKKKIETATAKMLTQQLVRTPLRDTQPFQSHLICTSDGRNLVQ